MEASMAAQVATTFPSGMFCQPHSPRTEVHAGEGFTVVDLSAGTDSPMIQLLQGMTPTWAVDQAFNNSAAVPCDQNKSACSASVLSIMIRRGS